MDLVQENIANLTSLWRTVSEKVSTFVSTEDFGYCAVDYSEWPNKLWFLQDIDEKKVAAAKEQIVSTNVKLGIPYFDVYQSQSHRLLEASGFDRLSEQVGMSLRLTETYREADTVRMERVSDVSTARLWEQLFRRAFDYKIDYRLLLPAYERTEFLVAYRQNSEPIGTAILHYSEDQIAGIHSMGIIPEMRRKGFAEQMMHLILNQAAAQSFQYATLQASAMGKGLYQKLGFTEQFVMKNYSLA